jgi:hypothetical protein
MLEEKIEAAKAEVWRLLDVGFMREVSYPQWLANVVMVRKKNGRWRMCTDFIDLNKCCPKDDFPLVRIDKIFDSASGFVWHYWTASQGTTKFVFAKRMKRRQVSSVHLELTATLECLKVCAMQAQLSVE